MNAQFAEVRIQGIISEFEYKRNGKTQWCSVTVYVNKQVNGIKVGHSTFIVSLFGYAMESTLHRLRRGDLIIINNGELASSYNTQTGKANYFINCNYGNQVTLVPNNATEIFNHRVEEIRTMRHQPIGDSNVNHTICSGQ